MLPLIPTPALKPITTWQSVHNMIIFYDPNSNNQVHAVYSHDTDSKVWEQRGYLRAAVNIPHLQVAVNRNTFVTIDGGEVIGIAPRTNPVQPTPDPKAVRVGELEAKLATGELTNSELNELARLERGL